jgi:hypothetical protein
MYDVFILNLIIISFSPHFDDDDDGLLQALPGLLPHESWSGTIDFPPERLSLFTIYSQTSLLLAQCAAPSRPSDHVSTHANHHP